MTIKINKNNNGNRGEGYCNAESMAKKSNLALFVSFFSILVFVFGQRGHAAPLESEAAKSTTSTKLDQFKITPTLGYTYFNVQEMDLDTKPKSGTSVAVLVQAPLNSGIELVSGLEYIETGFRKTEDIGFMEVTVAELDAKLLAVPLLARYTFNEKSDSTHYFAHGGLVPTYLMSAKLNTIFGDGDAKSDLNEFGLLSQVGLGANWALEAILGRVSLDLTYSYGLTKVAKESGGRTTGFQIQAGYMFSL